MKRKFLSLLLILALMPISSEALAAETYTAVYSATQGTGGWYFCDFRDEMAVELPYGTYGNGWNGYKSKTADYPTFSEAGAWTPPKTGDAGFKFVSPKSGQVKITGTASLPSSNAQNGNGVLVSIYKGDEQIYSNTAITYDSPASHEVTTTLRAGEELYFKINANGSNAWDYTIWWPSIEFVGEYTADTSDGYYYSESNGVEKLLSYNSAQDAYVAADGIAKMHYNNVTVTGDYSMMRRWNVPEDGRYQVHGYIEPNGENLLLTLKKNGVKIWEQLLISDEKNEFDVRSMCDAGDILDASLQSITGNVVTAQCKIEEREYIGTLPFCDTTSSVGYNFTVKNEKSFWDIVTMGKNVRFYSVKNSVEKDMIYNAEKNRYESPFDSDVGYISSVSAHPGTFSDSYMEYTLEDSGLIMISGNFTADRVGDGVVSKIFLNDEMLWSSRVGGERPVRWDEPFDVSYFVDETNVFANVAVGDKLTFVFDQWRKYNDDVVDLSDVKISYVEGDVLSKTTKWKRNNSILIDRTKNKLHKGDTASAISSIYENDEIYLTETDLKAALGDSISLPTASLQESGVDYYSTQSVADINDMNTAWIEDKILVLYSGLPTMFGYSEISEFEAALTYDGVFTDTVRDMRDMRFDFEGGNEGFTVNSQAKIAGVENGALKVIATGADPQLSLGGLEIPMNEYNYVRIGLKDTTANSSMNVFLSKNGGNYLQYDILTDRIPDKDFVEYVIDLSVGKLISGTKQEVYDKFRFDFMTNMYNSTDGAVQYIDYIVLSKNTKPDTAFIKSVKIDGEAVADFEPYGEVSHIELEEFSYRDLEEADVTVEFMPEHSRADYRTFITESDGVKYVDIVARNTDGEYRCYRVAAKSSGYGADIGIMAYDEENNKLEVEYTLFNGQSEEQRCTAILAVYSFDGMLKCASVANCKVADNSTTDFSGEITEYKKDSDDEIALFVWTDIEEMSPFIKAIKKKIFK